MCTNQKGVHHVTRNPPISPSIWCCATTDFTGFDLRWLSKNQTEAAHFGFQDVESQPMPVPIRVASVIRRIVHPVSGDAGLKIGCRDLSDTVNCSKSLITRPLTKDQQMKSASASARTRLSCQRVHAGSGLQASSSTNSRQKKKEAFQPHFPLRITSRETRRDGPKVRFQTTTYQNHCNLNRGHWISPATPAMY